MGRDFPYNVGGLNGSAQHLREVYPLESQSPRSLAVAGLASAIEEIFVDELSRTL